MKKTGISDLPLHYGRAPPWLFQRMVKLGKAITQAIILEYGAKEFLRRISDPYWFQAFGCVLGFDWHSSGLTTTLTGALKEGIDPEETGLAVCGGKGKTSRKTLTEIERTADVISLSTKKIERLQHASRLSAKIDTAAVQDGYQLYHHVIIFTEKGHWSVVQQGLNPENRYARRYHWLSYDVKSFVEEPHAGIVCDRKEKQVLDMTSKQSSGARKASLDIVKEKPERILTLAGQSNLECFLNRTRMLSLPENHIIKDMKRINLETLRRAYEVQPESYEKLLSVKGVGPKTIRALALISQLVYGEKPSWEDPVKFSFAHGGKDRIPYPVDKETYDKSIEVLETGIMEAKIGNKEKVHLLKKLKDFF